MGCHSLKYARYNRVADDLGIPYDLMEEHIIADPSVKIGSLMDNAMDTKSAKNWFGAAPPDLTLVARSRNPDWLYTYLRSFYRDDTRPYGVNNRVYPNVGMPHALLELQGLLECSDGHGDGNASDSQGDESHGSASELTSEGSQTTDEYDGTIYDLVNFLAYVAEPMKADRQRIGVYALLLIAIFYVFASLLNREYWKDVH